MTCPTCAIAGRRGYCAPLRCYCGHAACHAFASWSPLKPLNVTPINRAQGTAWADRKESTWIDAM